MPNFSIERDLAFLLSDAARLLRTCADQEARRFGMTRAQWGVLFRLQRNEGLKQSELADLLEVQPITLTRLIDRLCDNGLIERRSDPNDRRVKRLFLTPAAKTRPGKGDCNCRDHDGKRACRARPSRT